MMAESLVGKGREAIPMIIDPDSWVENLAGDTELDPEFGPGAVVGTAKINGKIATILANDAQAINPRFPVVYFGVIGMEEAYKMALAVYATIEADRGKQMCIRDRFHGSIDNSSAPAQQPHFFA